MLSSKENYLELPPNFLASKIAGCASKYPSAGNLLAVYWKFVSKIKPVMKF